MTYKRSIVHFIRILKFLRFSIEVSKVGISYRGVVKDLNGKKKDAWKLNGLFFCFVKLREKLRSVQTSQSANKFIRNNFK